MPDLRCFCCSEKSPVDCGTFLASNRQKGKYFFCCDSCAETIAGSLPGFFGFSEQVRVGA